MLAQWWIHWPLWISYVLLFKLKLLNLLLFCFVASNWIFAKSHCIAPKQLIPVKTIDSCKSNSIMLKSLYVTKTTCLCRNVYFWRGAPNFWIGSTPEIVIIWHNCVHQCWPQLRCHPMKTSQYMCCYLGALPLVLNNMSRGGAPCPQCIYYINTFKDYCFIIFELCTISLYHMELGRALT